MTQSFRLLEMFQPDEKVLGTPTMPLLTVVAVDGGKGVDDVVVHLLVLAHLVDELDEQNES